MVVERDGRQVFVFPLDDFVKGYDLFLNVGGRRRVDDQGLKLFVFWPVRVTWIR